MIYTKQKVSISPVDVSWYCCNEILWGNCGLEMIPTEGDLFFCDKNKSR